MADRRWELDQKLTAVVIGVVALAGGVVGVVKGATQVHVGVGWIFVVVIDGLGGALIAGFVALIVLSVAAALWSLLVHVVRRLVRGARSGDDE